jgi:hypothetical protein
VLAYTDVTDVTGCLRVPSKRLPSSRSKACAAVRWHLPPSSLVLTTNETCALEAVVAEEIGPPANPGGGPCGSFPHRETSDTIISHCSDGFLPWSFFSCPVLRICVPSTSGCPFAQPVSSLAQIQSRTWIVSAVGGRLLRWWRMEAGRGPSATRPTLHFHSVSARPVAWCYAEFRMSYHPTRLSAHTLKPITALRSSSL